MDMKYRYMDALEAACNFTDKLELSVNTPSYEFLKLRMGDKFLMEEVRELDTAIDERDDAEIVDGAIDVAFIAITQAYQLFRIKGYTHGQSVYKTRMAFLEVCRTNLEKNPPTAKGEKITKPANWTKPRIADLLRHPGQGFMSEDYARNLDEAEAREAAAAASIAEKQLEELNPDA